MPIGSGGSHGRRMGGSLRRHPPTRRFASGTPKPGLSFARSEGIRARSSVLRGRQMANGWLRAEPTQGAGARPQSGSGKGQAADWCRDSKRTKVLSWAWRGRRTHRSWLRLLGTIRSVCGTSRRAGLSATSPGTPPQSTASRGPPTGNRSLLAPMTRGFGCGRWGSGGECGLSRRIGASSAWFVSRGRQTTTGEFSPPQATIVPSASGIAHTDGKSPSWKGIRMPSRVLHSPRMPDCSHQRAVGMTARSVSGGATPGNPSR